MNVPRRPRRPDLFIAGAPKSGTTSLYHYLAGHPQVFMSPAKEPFYFCPDVRVGPRPRLEHPDDEARYLALFNGAQGAVRAGEATTRYLGSVEAPGLVRAFAPDAYVVVSLRDPVAMLKALHDERVANGNEDIVDFGEALAADDDRRRGKRLPRGANSAGAVYIEAARYGVQLERWLGAFERERIHIIVFDDLRTDTPSVFRGLLEFLEIDTDYQPSEFRVHNSRHRPRPVIHALAQSSPGQLISRRLLPALVGEHRRARLTQRFLHSRLARRRHAVEPVAPAIRQMLERELEQDVARVSALLGRDLGALWFGRSAVEIAP